MLNLRRLYIYAAAFIGLLLFMAGGAELLRLVILAITPESALDASGDWWRERLSLNLALVAVGAPLWIGHWVWAQRLARASAERKEGAEAGSALRALYFLGVLAVALVQTAGAAGDILSMPLARIAGANFLTLAPLEDLASLFVYGLFWLYHIRQRPLPLVQSGAAATISRWYWYAASYGCLGVVVSAVISALYSMLERLIGVDALETDWWQLPLANSAAWLAVGSIGWAYHWAVIQRQVGESQSPELRSILRKVYLYALVGASAAGALLAIGRILYLALLEAMGAVDERLGLIDDFSWVAPISLVAATGWFYHRYLLQRDAALVAEAPRQAAIRRGYSYILCAIGAALLAVGVFGILRLIIAIFTGQAATLDLPEHYLQEQLSLYVTLLLVGLGAWVWYWRNIQTNVADDASDSERGSLVRRIYLYVVASASVLALVIAAGTLLYQGLRSILGISAGDDFVNALNVNVSAALVAAAALLYHVRFLRAEHRPRPKQERDAAAEQPAAGEAAAAGSVLITISGMDVRSARHLIDQAALPEGATLAFAESELSPHEVQTRLQSRPQDED